MTHQFILAVSCDGHLKRAINTPLNLLDLCIELAPETIRGTGKYPGNLHSPSILGGEGKSAEKFPLPPEALAAAR